MDQECIRIALVYVGGCEEDVGRLDCGFVLLHSIFYILYSIFYILYFVISGDHDVTNTGTGKSRCVVKH